MHFGVDYGSKLAGTTVVCFEAHGQLHLKGSAKKEDADKFLQSLIDELQPERVFIDAPLSLPSAYYGKGNDFFYRECDRLTKAMSPMFLGGPTARAMKLASQNSSVKFLETYPAALAAELDIPSSRKAENFSKLSEFLPMPPKNKIVNGHQYDAVLAWLSGNRYLAGKAKILGEESEGQVCY
jgi:predicted nuclease with RNAse H fold